MSLEVIDYTKKYRDEMCLNIGELVKGTKIPLGDKGKVPWHNEINENNLDQERGLCVFCGTTSNNLMVIDLDDEKLFEHFENYKNQTFIVKSGKKGYHIYFRTIETPKSKSLTNSNGQHIDILGQGKIAVLPPSIHPDTNISYKIISDNKIKQLTSIDENEIYQKLKSLGFTITTEQKPIIELHDKNFIKLEGQNRGEDLLRVIDSWKSKNPELTESMLYLLANEYNNLHFNPPYHEDKIHSLVRQGFEYIEKKIREKEYGLNQNDEGKRISKNKNVIDYTASLIKSTNNFVTLANTDEILLYNGKIYSKFDAESVIKSETEKIIESCTSHDRNEVINKIKAQTYANLEEFDSNSNLITLENGVLNLDSLELHSHNSEYLSRVLLPVEFTMPIFTIHDDSIFDDIEKNLCDTLFWKFLTSSFTVNGDFRKEDFQTVLEIIASTIIKHHVDEKAFMFLGQGENGKSVCLDYVRSLIGEKNISRISLQDIAEDKFMRANLSGKSVNIFTDLESGEMKHTGKIKAITSGEGLEAQEKYQPPFTLYPFCKLMFSCNRFPKIYDQAHGFFRRWIIIKWERNFENDPERIEYLREKLASNQDEKNQVFSCLVFLARKLNKVGKFTHSKDWETTQKEWNSNADPIDDFASNYIVDSESNKTKRETYQYYKKVMLSKGEAPLGMGQFSKLFAEYYDEDRLKESQRTERVWLNIDFKPILEECDAN